MVGYLLSTYAIGEICEDDDADCLVMIEVKLLDAGKPRVPLECEEAETSDDERQLSLFLLSFFSHFHGGRRRRRIRTTVLWERGVGLKGSYRTGSRLLSFSSSVWRRTMLKAL